MDVTRGPGARENHYTIIVGKKRFGKTTYARKVVAKGQRLGKSLVFIDPTKRNADFGRVVGSGKALWSVARDAIANKKPFNVVVQLGWGASYDDFWELLFNIGNIVLVLDEVHMVASANRISPPLENLIRMGGNQCIDIITTTQNPPGIHGTLKNNSDSVISFRQKTRHYAEVVASDLFALGGRDRDAMIKILLTLPQFHYVHFSEDHGLTRGIVTP